MIDPYWIEFHCTLYECLTGMHPESGNNVKHFMRLLRILALVAGKDARHFRRLAVS